MNDMNDDDMPTLTEAELKKARRVTPAEHETYRKALEETFNKPFPSRMGRPPKDASEKHVGVFIKLHPRVLAWARAIANKCHSKYQTVINETLLQKAHKGSGHLYFVDKPIKSKRPKRHLVKSH